MKTKQIIKGTLLIGTLAVFSGCATTSYQSTNQMQPMINKVCNSPKPKEITPWSAYNLYDCKTKSWFIPYELWSGASFDGNKSNSINHQVDTSTEFSYREDKPNKMRSVTIKGALPWIDIPTGTHHKIYK
jgi:hypothetical protein